MYWPRLQSAAATFSKADFWWRPHEGTNSAANLLLHLDGNIRQWILAGLGGAEDRRDRPSEFAAREGPAAKTIMEGLGATIAAAASIIAALPDERLAEPYTCQGFEMTVLAAIYHVVEHLSWHTGQVVWLAKLRGGDAHGIAFYDDSKL